MVTMDRTQHEEADALLDGALVALDASAADEWRMVAADVLLLEYLAYVAEYGRCCNGATQ